jgi:nitrogen fixation NifU-like protein
MDRQERIDLILDHFEKPRHKGASGTPVVTHTSGNPGCGDTVTVYLTEHGSDQRVTLSFEGEGCTISQAAASMVMEMMQGWTVQQIAEATAGPLLALLGPEIAAARERCATLAFNAVKHASRELADQWQVVAPVKPVGFDAQ